MDQETRKTKERERWVVEEGNEKMETKRKEEVVKNEEIKEE